MRKQARSATWLIVAIVTTASLAFLDGRFPGAPLALIGVVALGVGFMASTRMDWRHSTTKLGAHLTKNEVARRLAGYLRPIPRHAEQFPSHYRWNCWPMFAEEDIMQSVRSMAVQTLRAYLPYVDAVVPISLGGYRLFKPIEGALGKPVKALTEFGNEKHESSLRVILCDVAINRGTTLALSIEYAISLRAMPVLMFSVVYNDDWPAADETPIVTYCKGKLRLHYLFTTAELVESGGLVRQPSYAGAVASEKQVANALQFQIEQIIKNNPISENADTAVG